MNSAKQTSYIFGWLKIFSIVLILSAAVPSPVAARRKILALAGEVKDQRGAVIAKAAIVLASETQAERQTASDNQGAFRFEPVPSGTYRLRVFAPGFAAHEEIVELNAAAARQTVSIVLYPTVRADVEVASDDAVAALGAERAAGTRVLSRRELEDLPDDPDALGQELQNLAASAGGAPGGAIVTVDGFLSGGRLPPKSAINAVRINPNLYSAEYDTPPFQGGRVEITTKPGSGAPAGSVFFNFNNAALNARDPFAAKRAASNTNRYGFSFGAPVVKNRAGFFLDFERRRIDEAATINAVVLGEVFLPANFVFNQPNPKRLTVGSMRADFQPNPNRTIVFRFDFNQNNLFDQGVGGINLPERGFDNRQTENGFRLIDTAALGSRAVNELRVGFIRTKIEQTAASNQPAIVVAGSFAAGGANLQQLARDEKRLEIADYLTTDRGAHNLKFGVQIFNRRIGELRAENTNGTFFFGGSVAGGASVSSLEQYRRALLGLPGGAATRFSIARGAARVAVNQWLFAAFVQDEWRLNPKMSLSLGWRYEAQTAPQDAASLAPRFGVAVSPDKKQNWILRARGGVYYERFEDALTLEAQRLDGFRQQQLYVDSPSFAFPLANNNLASAIATVRRFAANLNPPVSLQMRVEVERQLPRGWKISASHSWTFAQNRLRSRNINAPVVIAENPNPPTAPRPLGEPTNILQFESSGKLRGRVLYVGVNQNSNKFFSLNAGYLNFDFRTDADNAFALPQSSYGAAGEWARPVWQIRHRVFVSSTFNLPRKLRLAASLNAASGFPYNVTTGRDNNGDGNFNDRPEVVSFNDSKAISTIFGFLDPNVVNGNLRRNAGINPATATLDLNLSRVFVVGKRGDQGDSRYKLTANIRAANALNRANLTGTIGVLSSPLFGRPTIANPARRIEFGLRFNF